jgi:hypothetical protein
MYLLFKLLTLISFRYAFRAVSLVLEDKSEAVRLIAPFVRERVVQARQVSSSSHGFTLLFI